MSQNKANGLHHLKWYLKYKWGIYEMADISNDVLKDAASLFNQK